MKNVFMEKFWTLRWPGFQWSDAAALLKEDLSMSTQQHISLSLARHMICNFFTQYVSLILIY